jgi:hypothetical protein
MAYKEIPSRSTSGPVICVPRSHPTRASAAGMSYCAYRKSKGAGACLLFLQLQLWTSHHLQRRLEQHLGQFLFQENITSLVQRYLYGDYVRWVVEWAALYLPACLMAQWVHPIRKPSFPASRSLLSQPVCCNKPKLQFHVNPLMQKESSPSPRLAEQRAYLDQGTDLAVKALVALADKLVQGTILTARHRKSSRLTRVYGKFTRLWCF